MQFVVGSAGAAKLWQAQRGRSQAVKICLRERAPTTNQIYIEPLREYYSNRIECAACLQQAHVFEESKCTSGILEVSLLE